MTIVGPSSSLSHITVSQSATPSGSPPMPGPWVLVIGMHRAGTSAVTGALAGMGMALPPDGDLMEGEPGNPIHYESASLSAFNDSILRSLGGRWDVPPEVSPGWENSPPLAERDDEACSMLIEVFPGPGVRVWKDPRNCLLLPYWRRLLGGPVAAVFIWRSPLAVARSLRVRDGMALSLGMALWEHYNRRALESMAGLPVYVVSNDSLLSDPAATLRGIAGWLDGTGIAPADSDRSEEWNVEAGAAAVSSDLAKNRGEEDSGLLPGQRDLIDRFRELGGPHAALPRIEMGPPSTWAVDTLDVERRLADLSEGNRRLSEQHQELIASFKDLTAVAEKRQEDVLKLYKAAENGIELSKKLDRENRRLESTIAALRAELERISHERDETAQRLERLEAELVAVSRSASWRLTAPLRSMKGVLADLSTRPK